MNKVKQLDELVSRGFALAKTKTEKTEQMTIAPNTPPISNVVVSVDEAEYTSWRNDVKQFLTDNDLTGFLCEPCICFHGNYAEFEPQHKMLFALKGFDEFLGTKLTFKPKDMEFYVLKILAENDKNKLNYLDNLAAAVGNADVRETLENLQRAQMLNITIRYGANGDFLYVIPADNSKFLSIQGRNKLAEIQKSKTKKTPTKTVEEPVTPTVVVPQSIPTKNRKNIWKWLVGLIGSAGIILYFIISVVNNQQSNNALNNAIITNSTVNLYQNNDAQIAPNIKVAE